MVKRGGSNPITCPVNPRLAELWNPHYGVSIDWRLPDNTASLSMSLQSTAPGTIVLIALSLASSHWQLSQNDVVPTRQVPQYCSDTWWPFPQAPQSIIPRFPPLSQHFNEMTCIIKDKGKTLLAGRGRGEGKLQMNEPITFVINSGKQGKRQREVCQC